MNEDQAIGLLIRQIKDIQAQADKIQTGDNSPEAIESFSKYSQELKSYVIKRIDSDEIKSYLKEIPDINYSKTTIKLWQYLIFPSWWLSVAKDYQAKNKTLEQIKLVRGKYATLEILVKGLTN